MSKINSFKIDEFSKDILNGKPFPHGMFIEASAGTGKTYTVKKLVSLLLKKGVSLKQILIVTYTEKATGELRDRIRDEIKTERSNEDLNENEKHFLDFALREVENAPIFTIHSFCQKALRDNAFESGQAFSIDMVDDGQAVADFIQKKIRDEWVNADDFIELTKRYESVDKLQEDLVSYFKTGIINYFEGVEIYVNPYINAKSYQDLIEIKEFKEQLELLKNSSYKKKNELITTLQQWKFGESLFNGSTFKTSNEWTEICNFLKSVKEFVDKKNIVDNLIQSFLFPRIKSLYKEWRLYKQEHGLQSFNDMIDSVREKVKENSFRLALQNQYKYAIIDEFQDTNLRQWDVFKTLFLDSPEHHIVVVGDPKQSIYSFQGADVNVYTQAIHEIGKNGEAYKLPINYRSTNSMIDACNKLFQLDDFTFGEGIKFEPSEKPNNKKEPQFDGKEIKPFQISPSMSPEEFAKLAVKKIIECTTYTSKGENAKTRLQVFDKENPDILRNVTFKDFAILARVRSEMEPIEAVLREYGVPHFRYKDSNLFGGRECLEWIALFQALNARDFTGFDNRYLNEVLVTDFFGISITDVENEKYSRGDSNERILIQNWKKLIEQRQFAQFLENVFEKSKICKKLGGVSKLQEYSKIKQIGDYAIDYLYNNQVSIDKLILHLQSLYKNEGNSDVENGNLVAKSSDFNAVQLMTIHASKGLEFPIVISVAGFKKRAENQDSKKLLLHHDSNTKILKLGADDEAKKQRKNEEKLEWKRLFYVNYTRASSVLVLPSYEKFYEDFLDVFKGDSINKNLIEFYDELKTEENRTPEEWKQEVKNILDCDSKKEPNNDNKTNIKLTNDKIPFAIQKSHSYSSLTHGEKHSENIYSEDGINLRSQNGEEESTDLNSDLDSVGIVFQNSFDGFSLSAQVKNYPRGASIGNVIHNTLESLCNGENGLFFSLFKYESDIEKEKSFELLKSNEILRGLIIKNFKKEGLYSLDETQMKSWVDYTIELLWNTLNANLKDVHKETTFKLSEIKTEDAIAEMEYYLNADEEMYNAFCKGFMDLIFKRKDANGNERYCILDWKSDYLEKYNSLSIETRVNESYSIQRVLYSYCLIQWLKTFEPNKSEEEIFNEKFGGIYYVLVRGTKADSSNGIYGKTWDSYEQLQNSYEKIQTLIAQKV